MRLETYFEFANNRHIRIVGTRVGIETVVLEYERGASPEEIMLRHPTLTLEQIHATILYYLANREQVQHYIEQVRQQAEANYAKWLRDPQGGASTFVRDLRTRLNAERARLKEVQHKDDETPIPA
jgi:uncharacterized protein (DUF433 family)